MVNKKLFPKDLFGRAIGILLILIYFSGCTTTMTVNSVDPNGRPINGATVLVDGENIGQTPNASTSTSNGLWVKNEIRVQANGFQSTVTEADKEIKIPILIGGILIWPLLLWCYGPKEQQNVVLTPAQ